MPEENIIKLLNLESSFAFFFFKSFTFNSSFFQLGPDTDRHRDHLCADRLRPVLLLLPRSVLCEGRGPETADEEIRHIEEARVFTSVCVCLNNVLNYLMFVYIIYRTYCEIVLILVTIDVWWCVFSMVYTYRNVHKDSMRNMIIFHGRGHDRKCLSIIETV